MHNCKETLPSSAKPGWISIETCFDLENQTGFKQIKNAMFYRNKALWDVQIIWMKILISLCCSFYSIGKISLFTSSKRYLRTPKIWRYISTVLFHKQAHQILLLLSCVIRSAYDRNLTNPSFNLSFFRNLCIVISEYYCHVILTSLSI